MQSERRLSTAPQPEPPQPEPPQPKPQPQNKICIMCQTRQNETWNPLEDMSCSCKDPMRAIHRKCMKQLLSKQRYYSYYSFSKESCCTYRMECQRCHSPIKFKIEIIKQKFYQLLYLSLVIFPFMTYTIGLLTYMLFSAPSQFPNAISIIIFVMIFPAWVMLLLLQLASCWIGIQIWYQFFNPLKYPYTDYVRLVFIRSKQEVEENKPDQSI